MRIAPLLAVLLFASCSLTEGQKEEDKTTTEKVAQTAPQKATSPQQDEPKTEAPRFEEPPYIPNSFDDPMPIPSEVPDRVVPDPVVDEPAEQPPQTGHLDEYLTTLFGVRLPLSTSWLALESEIGRPPYVTVMTDSTAAGGNEFVREFVITANRSEVFINKYKIADLVCTTESGEPCEGVYDEESEPRIFQVEVPGSDITPPDEVVVPPLLEQLQYFQKTRHSVLRSLSDEALSWSLNCDIYTVAMDRELTYGVLARIIHTAGFADLTRVRLVVRDENETLNYLPFFSPRFDSAQKERFHIVGDAWWGAEDREGGGFQPAYLAYTGSAQPEDFMSFYPQSLPVCLPPDITWDSVLDEEVSRRDAAARLLEYMDTITETHEAVLGLQMNLTSPAHSPSQPVPEAERAVASVPALTEAVNSASAIQPTGVAPDKTSGGLMKGVVVPDKGTQKEGQLDAGDLPSRLPAVEDAQEEREYLDEEVVPFLFVTRTSVTLALREPSGEVVEVVEFPSRDFPKLYPYLERMRGKVLNVGASMDLPISRLVSVVDAVRYRCDVYSMSGKCKHWDPLMPTIFLFAAPDDRFAPDQATPPEEAPILDATAAPASPEAPAELSADGTEVESDEDDSDAIEAKLKKPAEVPGANVKGN